MTVDEMIHDRWRDMTDNGKLDHRVAVAEALFQDFRDKLRGYFNPRDETMQQFDQLQRAVISDVKRLVVSQPRWSGSRDEVTANRLDPAGD